MHPIRSPQTKAGLKYQQKQWKAHIHMEAELNDNFVKGEIKKEMKGLIEFIENEGSDKNEGVDGDVDKDEGIDKDESIDKDDTTDNTEEVKPEA